MLRSLNGSVIVITGASSGIGRAAAHAFAERGAAVVLAARSLHDLQIVSEECERLGGRALAMPIDVTEPDAVEALARAAEQRFGGIDVWINNAGVIQYGAFDEVPLEDFRRVVETNFFGYVNGARAALRRFRRQGGGILINNASGFGIVGQPFASAYTSSKFAIRGLSETLRQEYADHPDIHICTILPAAIDTPIYQHAANVSGRAVRPVDPIYPASAAADAMVDLVLRPRRERPVGTAAWALHLQKRLMPATTERLMGQAAARLQFGDRGVPETRGNLFAPLPAAVSGGWRNPSSHRLRWAAAAVLGVGILVSVSGRRNGRPGSSSS